MATLYKTLDEAKQALMDNPQVVSIIEIEPSDPEAGKYIGIKCSINILIDALKRKPMPEIKRVIGEAFDMLTYRIKAHDQRLAELFPGLNEIRAARSDESRYHHQFNQMMEDGNNDGVRPPVKVRVSSADMVAQYPAAAAYLKAEGYTNSNNSGKYSAGKRAMDRLLAGEDYKLVIVEMEREWSDYAMRNTD